jgi:hypothetical protein
MFFSFIPIFSPTYFVASPVYCFSNWPTLFTSYKQKTGKRTQF